MGEIFYISDLHIGHKNALSYDNRPFVSVEENDAEIKRRWNEHVGFDDEVYILGDISWLNATKTIEYYSSLNGRKHLIRGNHDGRILKCQEVRDLFVEITDYKEIQFTNDYGVVLCHYPIPCFNHHYYDWVHLYGHVHNSFEWNMMEHTKLEMVELYNKNCNMYNVGCMIPYMDYTPRTLEEIIDRADKYYKGETYGIEPRKSHE